MTLTPETEFESTATMTVPELLHALGDTRKTLHDILAELKWRSRVGGISPDRVERWVDTIREIADEISPNS
jgi:hypothetical protein